MIIWILVSFVLKMADVWCMPDENVPESVSGDLPELNQIDNFLASIQKKLQDGNAVIEEFQQSNNDTDQTSTTLDPEKNAPDILNDKTFTKAFGVFLHLLVTKHSEDVIPVVKHSKDIIHSMIAEDQLAWLTEPLKKVVINIAIGLSDLPLLQTRAALIEFFHEIKNRNEEYRPKVNELFDKANSMVDEKNEQNLEIVMDRFRAFQKDSSDGKKLCQDIIEAFQKPFADNEGTPELAELIRESNIALKERFKVIQRKARRSESDDSGFERVKKRMAVLSHVEKFLDRLQLEVEDGEAKLQNIYRETTGNESLYSNNDNETADNPPDLPSATDPAEIQSAFSEDVREMGLFTFVIQKLWSLFVLKKQKDVGDVLRHIKSIVNKKAKDGNLDWLGTSLKQLVVDTGNAISNLPSSMIIHSALGIYKDLNNRHTVYSPEVNKIINKTDEIYTEEDALNVLKAINTFEDYPKERDKSARQICEGVIDALLEPLKKNPEGAAELNSLLESANQILNSDSRFKLVFFKSDNFRRSFSNNDNSRLQRKFYAISRKPLEDLSTAKYYSTCPSFYHRSYNNFRPYLGYVPPHSRSVVLRQGLPRNTRREVKLFAEFSKPYHHYTTPQNFKINEPNYFGHPRRINRLGRRNRYGLDNNLPRV